MPQISPEEATLYVQSLHVIPRLCSSEIPSYSLWIQQIKLWGEDLHRLNQALCFCNFSKGDTIEESLAFGGLVHCMDQHAIKYRLKPFSTSSPLLHLYFKAKNQGDRARGLGVVEQMSF